jgi:hypothetical protein
MYGVQAKNSEGVDTDLRRTRALSAYKDFLTLWKTLTQTFRSTKKPRPSTPSCSTSLRIRSIPAADHDEESGDSTPRLSSGSGCPGEFRPWQLETLYILAVN